MKAAPPLTGPPSASRTTLMCCIFIPGVWPLFAQKYGKYRKVNTSQTRNAMMIPRPAIRPAPLLPATDAMRPRTMNSTRLTAPTITTSMMYAISRAAGLANLTPGAGPMLRSAGVSQPALGGSAAMAPPSGPGSPSGSPSGRGHRAHRIRAEIGPKDIGHGDRAVRLLVDLEDRGDDPREGEARPVQGVDQLRLRALLGAVADRHPAGLVIAEVGARADLQPALHAGRPDLEVVLLALDEAHLARAHEQDAIWQPEPL